MKNNFCVWFGVWIIILPFLGVPGSWKTVLTVLSGIFFILCSLWPTIIKKLQTKPKQKKKKEFKEGEEKREELRFSEKTDADNLPPTL